MVTTEEAIVDAIPLQQKESLDSAMHAATADREGSTLVVPEKPSEDGYNWRKYGQKNVKGNKLIRSYYKCSYHNCLVKKQVERAHDGRITDTSYFGKHDHPRPQTSLVVAVPSVLSIKVQTMDNCSDMVANDKSSSKHALTTDDAELKETSEPSTVPTSVEGTCDAALPSSTTKEYANNDDSVVSKRRKKGVDDLMSMDNKPTSESRRVVETVSAVDIVNDGYRWRKYGQKLVKDNPNARSYYRCSTHGCPAKKRVERASRDPKVVITTYEGNHDHVVPPLRTLLSHVNSPGATMTAEHNGVNNKADEVNRAQNSAAICKQEQGSTIELPAEKDDAPEVSPAQSSAAICKQEQGNTTDRPAEKDESRAVNGSQSSAAICKQEQGNTADPPAEKDDPAEVNRAQNNAVICKQEQGNTTDHPADDPSEVNPAQSGAAICKEEQFNTTDRPAEEEDPAEVQRACNSAICKQEPQDPVEKDERPTELMRP